MAIDPRIALGVQPVQIQSPLASFGQALQLKDLIGQQDMRALQMREYERKQQEEMTLRDLMRGKSGPELETALTQAGYGERALGIRKERLAGDKSAAETQKAQLESAMKGYQFAANMAAGVNSQQAYEAMKAQFAQNPLFAPVVQNMPAQWSPEVSEELKRGALAAAGKIEAMLPKVTDRDVGGTIQTVSTDPVSGRQTVAGVTPKTMTPGDVQQSRDAAAGRAVTMRGQDLADRRAAESNSINAGKNVLETADRLRVEFNKLPEVEAYKSVIPAQKSAQEAIARDTPQADMNLIYATAKIFDPTSVVREGEYATVNASQSPVERMQGMLSYLMGGGRLTANTRRQLLDEINSRGAAAKTQYDAARKSYGDIAQKRGADPALVFQSLDEAEQQPRTGVAAPDKGAPKVPPPEAKPVTVNGQKMTAIRAPDGKYYVRQANGKYAEVIEDGATSSR